MERNIVEQLTSVNEEDIKRGHIYWAAVQFTEERPLGIFKQTNGNEGLKIEEDAETFKGRLNPISGKKESEIVDVIIRHKRRMVTVMQSEDSIGSYIYVLPITTYNGDNRKINFIKENPDNPQYQYIGNLTGKESVVNISDLKRIHKSLLMEKVDLVSINDNDMEIIGEKLASLMEIEKIEKCNDCFYKYENYLKDKEINSDILTKIVNE